MFTSCANELAWVGLRQGCQMVYFPTKNPKLGIFWRVMEWKMFHRFLYIVMKINLATLFVFVFRDCAILQKRSFLFVVNHAMMASSGQRFLGNSGLCNEAQSDSNFKRISFLSRCVIHPTTFSHFIILGSVGGRLEQLKTFRNVFFSSSRKQRMKIFFNLIIGR
jgi:hypothetical protein